MDQRKLVMQETAVIAVGELICSAVMVGLFAALGYFQMCYGALWQVLL